CGPRRASVCALANVRKMHRACVRERTFAAPATTDNAAMGTTVIQNELLAAMPRKAYDALAPALAPVTLPFGEVLYEADALITHVYFPCESMVSLLLPVAQPGHRPFAGQGAGAGRGQRAASQRDALQARARAQPRAAARRQPLRPLADAADHADRGVQPLPRGGGAPCALAPDDARSHAL